MTISKPAAAGCPIIEFDPWLARQNAQDALGAMDKLREGSAIWWNTYGDGFWLITRYDEVTEAFLDTDLFTNDSQDALDPEQVVRFIPQSINPPQLGEYRKALLPWFSIPAVAQRTKSARAQCRRRIEALAGDGSCEFVEAFALPYPNQVFMDYLGLPPEDAEVLAPWVEIFHQGFRGTDKSLVEDASAAMRAYFKAAIDHRRSGNVTPGENDFIGYLQSVEVFGRKMTDTEILDVCWSIPLAGMETTQNQLSQLFYHLATHDSDRKRLVADPALVPQAVEEAMRCYSIVGGMGRFVTRDTEFHGAPMRAGDMVWLGITPASRDPRKFDEGAQFDLGRKRHPQLAFGSGQHRCLGMHLAREEMVIATQEWLAQIPEFHLAGDPEYSWIGIPKKLPLAWKA